MKEPIILPPYKQGAQHVRMGWILSTGGACHRNTLQVGVFVLLLWQQ
jgi:hypothetical protein